MGESKLVMHLKLVSDLNYLMNKQQVADSKQAAVQTQAEQLKRVDCEVVEQGLLLLNHVLTVV